MTQARRIRGYFLTGLLIWLPAWGTFLILGTLFSTVNDVLEENFPAIRGGFPGIGFIFLVCLVLLAGAIGTHVMGQRLVHLADRWVDRIPLVRSIYHTLKGMTDLLNYRARFGRSAVIAFPFPSDGSWALGFAMGSAPAAVQATLLEPMMMVFVPAAIHPFTGYLAFIPSHQAHAINLSPEDAMKIEFSAGLYRPEHGWLSWASHGN